MPLSTYIEHSLSYEMNESLYSLSNAICIDICAPLFQSQTSICKKYVPSFSDFIPIRVLGEGGSGKVFLVRDGTNKLFAMKEIKKSKLTNSKIIEQIKMERIVLASIRSPFIPKLHASYQTNDKLYMIMEYCPGGELFFHLNRFRRMPEFIVRFIIAELILALETLHNQGYIYRDLKPENVMFDEQGHIKLCDMGLVKSGITCFTEGSYSICGTPEYMAPEMIQKFGYGFCVDFWALGLLTHELLSGLRPWYANNHTEFFHLIKTSPPSLSKKLSDTAKSFISGLLSKDPNTRLGVNGFSEIKTHSFFQGIDWSLVASKGLTPPFNPCDGQILNSLLDEEIQTDNFDPQFTCLPLTSFYDIDAQASNPHNRQISNSDLRSSLNMLNFEGFESVI